MLHCVAKNESAEEVQRPQPGLGEEVGSPPPQSPRSVMAPSVFYCPAALLLLKGHRVISWGIHLLACLSPSALFPMGDCR